MGTRPVTITVPGGVVYSTECACSPPAPGKFKLGDVFVCGECSAKYQLVNIPFADFSRWEKK